MTKRVGKYVFTRYDPSYSSCLLQGCIHESKFIICLFLTVTLRVLPNRSQFFQYESVSLSCGEQGICSNWTLKRNTSVGTNQVCFEPQERSNKSDCSLDDLYPFDSGVYWCESAAGECSDSVNITVTSGYKRN